MNSFKRKCKIMLLVILLFSNSEISIINAQTPQTYDIVIKGGRVIDPETGLDAVRNIGIRNDRIVEISESDLLGNEIINASGLVVSPGFIDLHAHGQSNRSNEFQARDGVTTALELEGGKNFIRRWYSGRTGNSVLNFGASVAQSNVRQMSMTKYKSNVKNIRRILMEDADDANRKIGQQFRMMANARYESLTQEETTEMVEGLNDELSAGAIGIGVPVGYYQAATREEIFRVFEFSAKMNSMIFTHVREMGMDAIQEMIANSASTSSALHIVHLNSMALSKMGVALDMISSAQKNGIDVTTEVYPYTAGSTSLQSTLFDPGWQERMGGLTYNDIQWEKTGERLTEETFKKYRKIGGTIIIHMMKPEWIRMGIASPITMIASDGMPYNPGAHPRSAGTFSRVLGKYSREMGVLSLKDALAKMTIMPAQRLEFLVPSMKMKGRIQVGCDADITIFDPNTIIDTATFEKDLSYSIGVEHVLVNGTFVVKNGETVKGVFPGRPVMGKYRR